MTQESMTDLQINTLIGMVEERGPAWHRRDDLRGDGEDNHYPRFIPTEDVKRRLLHWSPNTLPVAYLKPCNPDEADFIRADGVAVKIIETQNGFVGVLRDDNNYDMGVFKEGVVHPPYQVTLMRDAELLVGQTLGISSAGVLAKGARAWVEFSMPETAHDGKSGLSYRPNLVKADSMDGSMKKITAATITATVCDNTLTWNLLEAKRSGRLFTRKHTSGILADLESERAALGIIEQIDSEFTDELHKLIELELTPKQRIEVMDILVPLPEKPGRALTLAENKRGQLQALDHDPMVSPWVGTGFGEVQRFNTFAHHFDAVRGTGRSERNTWRALCGKTAEADREVVSALEKVLA